MLIRCFSLLILNLWCDESWAWDHASRDLLDLRLASEAPVLVACELAPLLLKDITREKLTNFHNIVLDV